MVGGGEEEGWGRGHWVVACMVGVAVTAGQTEGQRPE